MKNASIMAIGQYERRGKERWFRQKQRERNSKLFMWRDSLQGRETEWVVECEKRLGILENIPGYYPDWSVGCRRSARTESVLLQTLFWVETFSPKTGLLSGGESPPPTECDTVQVHTLKAINALFASWTVYFENITRHFSYSEGMQPIKELAVCKRKENWN